MDLSVAVASLIVALAMTLRAKGQAGVLDDSFGTGWIRLMGHGLIASRN